jgi:hypothetical protein
MSRSGTTRFTKSPRVTSSRTSVCSWSTSTRLRPRRPAQKSSATRWRLAASRTRYVLVTQSFLMVFSPQYLTTGSPGTPCRPCPGEATRLLGCGARHRRQRVDHCLIVDFHLLFFCAPPSTSLPLRFVRLLRPASNTNTLCIACSGIYARFMLASSQTSIPDYY